MALLKNQGPNSHSLGRLRLPAKLCACLLLLGVGGCSFVLDPDELVAERQEVAEDTVGETTPPDVRDVDSDGGDSDQPDTADGEDTADAADADDTFDVQDSDDGEIAEDTVEPVDTEEPDLVEDSEIFDTFLAEVTEVDTTEDTDTTPAVELIVRTSGDGDCTLDYYLQDLTSCPKTCGWTLVFDARASRGLTSFSWRFEVSKGYIVTPESSVGPVASVVVSTPACLFFPASSMRPAVVSASVSADGGPWTGGFSIPFSVRQVSMCGASLCDAP